MRIDDATLEEFQALYKRVYNESISADHARKIAQRLITVYCLLLRPLPSDAADRLRSRLS